MEYVRRPPCMGDYRRPKFEPELHFRTAMDHIQFPRTVYPDLIRNPFKPMDVQHKVKTPVCTKDIMATNVFTPNTCVYAQTHNFTKDNPPYHKHYMPMDPRTTHNESYRLWPWPQFTSACPPKMRDDVVYNAMPIRMDTTTQSDYKRYDGPCPKHLGCKGHRVRATNPTVNTSMTVKDFQPRFGVPARKCPPKQHLRSSKKPMSHCTEYRKNYHCVHPIVGIPCASIDCKFRNIKAFEPPTALTQSYA